MNKLLNREMYFNILDVKFNELMKMKQCFQDEIFKSEYNDYFSDIFEDNLKLMCIINDNYSGDYYIPEKLALRIMNHIESADDLLRDTRRYLSIHYGTSNIFERLYSYEKKRKVVK